MSRYSQLYIERGRQAPDSPRARVRLSALFSKIIPPETQDNFQDIRAIECLITSETGIRILDLCDFFLNSEVRDLLDSITLIYIYLKKIFTDTYSEIWFTEVNRVLSEENVAYRVYEDGIVHPFVDAEFETNRASALEALSEPRFGEARTDFEAAYRHLRDGNSKEALRMMFPAVEVAAKVLFPAAFSRLMPNEIDRHIVPRMHARYAGNQPALDAASQLLTGMKSWINAAQPYRHGQEIVDAAEPPTEFVVAHLSTGATYLRWMIELCSG